MAFGFFIMYFATWMATPADEVCAESRFAEGFMALTCFLVSWLCIGMGFGGYTDDSFVDKFCGTSYTSDSGHHV